ncbi:MAG: TIM barrel protein [Spirochaetaceae bacterium]|nr:TIM barrel protein [Spirochaetaceae bacterium]
MNLGLMINVWGDVLAHPAAGTSVRDSYYWTPCDLPQVVKFASAVGYSFLEVFDGNLMAFQDKGSELSDLLNQNEIPLKSVYTGGKFIFNDILMEDLKKIENVSNEAKKYGAKYVVIGGGAVTESDRKRMIVKMGTALNEVERIVNNAGLTAVYHPHLGSIVETQEEIDIVLNESDIQLCPDTGHIFGAGSDPVAVIKKYLPRIPYVHLKDMKDGNFYPPGDGEIDFPSMITAMKSDGRDRDYAVEIDGFPGQPELGVVKSYNQVQKLFL